MKNESSKYCDQNINIPNSKRRSLLLENEEPLPVMRINPKTNPGLFTNEMSETDDQVQSDLFIYIRKLLALWKICRYKNVGNILPRFSGLVATLYLKPGSEKSVLTYLPPIPKPITEYSTIMEVFYQSRNISKQGNMKYAHIVMDVGAAMKAYQVIWNNPELWSDIIIHLGDFHAMMMFFSVIGDYLKGSGFEEMVFQGKLCTPGSIKGVMKGKHYNRCWLIHEAFAECVEQLYMDSMNNPPSLNINNPSEVLNNLNNGEVKKYLSLCNSVHVNLNLGLTGRY